MFIWNGIKRIGRITLWLGFFPLGIWRSLRHGAKRDREKLLSEIKKQQQS